MPKFIPAKITRPDLLEALRPLLDLLGVTENEIYDDLRIADGLVVFTLAATPDDADTEAEFPAGVALGTYVEGDAREFAEFSSRITVQVI